MGNDEKGEREREVFKGENVCCDGGSKFGGDKIYLYLYWVFMILSKKKLGVYD